MAPPKSSRAVGDDHKADNASTGSKEKGTGPTSAKMRRGASQSSASQLREAANAPTSAPSQNAVESQAPTINWSSFERDALHTYRREHQLNTPASFVSKFHHSVLSRPGSIGHYSPTMIRKQQARRESKDTLAKAVRKHFNGLGIQENDVIVDFIYRIRSEKISRAGGPNRQPGIIWDH
ncbi:sin3 binding region of histone deacetylase complex subunit SAP30 domain-containing protein [Pochonia chlamydosporia 170]|uniref:Sin3 binding region of histone deacetylase complex subunit SAP30 domain-containing protein n=1 Tax=Pochonia chlamydosporia 170 TaxID=1380566 RepID=A0A179FTU5_METCM|nr:sin3 binding region of histone deacetylase complex subunit SAP30 domain-containing protein [Pochonia chlamydosporia 170]OAQ69014.1 sin3 binding region of histone deacetylase complex subunit SAP30 domain-containing protein [Pochonia chlamydosporia 170]